MKHVIIEKIELLEIAGRKEIRIDWSNDRHQSVDIEFGRPEDVLMALENAAFLVGAEIQARKLQ